MQLRVWTQLYTEPHLICGYGGFLCGSVFVLAKYQQKSNGTMLTRTIPSPSALPTSLSATYIWA
jgi:hypothetical protein